MTATHTIKFTRISIEHPWPFTAFFKQWWENDILKYLHDLQPSGYQVNTWHPLTIQNNMSRWHTCSGFVDYNYSEYDPLSDIKAEKLIEEGNDTFDLITIQRKMTYNPSTLTLTQNIIFDNFNNLKLFLMKANDHWISPTEEEVLKYMAEKSITVSEETRVDGNVVTDSIKLFS